MSVDIGRYRRQITLAGFGLDAQQALADAHVAVLGAGGLGSPALLYLAACGVGTVTVIDDDTVERPTCTARSSTPTPRWGRPR